MYEHQTCESVEAGTSVKAKVKTRGLLREFWITSSAQLKVQVKIGSYGWTFFTSYENHEAHVKLRIPMTYNKRTPLLVTIWNREIIAADVYVTLDA